MVHGFGRKVPWQTRGYNKGLGDYRFDIGPTFLMMKFILDAVFAETGRRAEDYMDFVELDPMYALDFGDRVFRPTRFPDKLAAEVERVFPGASPILS